MKTVFQGIASPLNGCMPNIAPSSLGAARVSAPAWRWPSPRRAPMSSSIFRVRNRRMRLRKSPRWCAGRGGAARRFRLTSASPRRSRGWSRRRGNAWRYRHPCQQCGDRWHQQCRRHVDRGMGPHDSDPPPQRLSGDPPGAAVMYRQNSGKIINTASQLAYKASPGLSHYVAAKAAIVAFTRCLCPRDRCAKRQCQLRGARRYSDAAHR